MRDITQPTTPPQNSRLVSDSIIEKLALPLPASWTRRVLALGELDGLLNRASALEGSGIRQASDGP